MAEFLGMVVGKNIRMFRLCCRFIRRHKVMTVLSTFVLVIFLSLSCFNNVNAEGKDDYTFKYYHTITVSSGDTLWLIASENRGDIETRTYIDEIKSINHLRDEAIYAGDILVIPYYSNDFME